MRLACTKSGTKMLVAALAAVTAMTMSGCSSSEDSTSPKKSSFGAVGSGDIPELKVALGAGGRSLDPAHAYDGTSSLINNEVLEGLLTYEPDGELVPRLAKSWKEASPTSYVYDLRPGVEFSDGSPLTAEDAVFSIERQMDPKVASEYSSYFGSVKSVAATGDLQVTVTLKAADPYWKYVPGFAWPVVQKKFVEAHPKDLGTPSAMTIGTGPYVTKKFSPTTGATLVRNESYWGDKPAAKTITYVVIADPEARRLAMQSGDVDATWSVPLSQSSSWDSISQINVGYVSGTASSFYSFDVTKAPFDDVHLRKAISYAVDREGIAKAIFKGRADPLVTPLPKSVWSGVLAADEVNKLYADLPDYAFDLKKAKAELSKSRYADGLEITLPVVTGTDDVKVAETLKENLKSLGITLTIKPVSSADWFGAIYSHDDLGMQAMRLASDYPDPYAWTKVLMNKEQAKANGFNTSDYYNAETEKLLQIQASSTEVAERTRAAEGLMKAAADDAAYVGIIAPQQGFALSQKLAYDGALSQWTQLFGDWVGRIKPAAK
ncbi:ABC transporter substrate-binding protein [Aeromicrobium sp. P5_D10]